MVAMQHPDRSYSIFRALEHASENGSLDMMEVLYPYHPICDSTSEAASESVEAVDLETAVNIMTWLGMWKEDDFLAYLVAVAVKYRHVDMVRWLMARWPAWCTSLKVNRQGHHRSGAPHRTAMEGAARYGQLDLLELFLDSGLDGWTGDEVVNAAARGHFEVVQWLFAHRTERVVDARRFENAVYNQHFEVIRYLHSKGVTNFGDCAGPASYSSNLDMIKWFLEHYPNAFPRVALRGAVRCGYIHIVKYLQQSGIELGRIHSSYMDGAASEGHLNTIKWVYEHRNENELCTIKGLSRAALKGHLSTVKYLHEHGVKKSWAAESYPEYYPMAEAARFGHLEVVKFIGHHDMLWYFDDETDEEEETEFASRGVSAPEKRAPSVLLM